MARRSNGNNRRRADDTNNNSQGSEGRKTLTPTEKARLRDARRKMRVRIDGKDKEITAADAVLQKSFQSAVGGSPHAQGQYLRNLQAAEEIEARNIAANIETGWRIKHDADLRLKAMVEAGEDPKWMLIHPDDVNIIDGVGYTIDGPAVQEELYAYARTCRRRDLFIKQAVLEERLGNSADTSATRASQTDAQGSDHSGFSHNDLDDDDFGISRFENDQSESDKSDFRRSGHNKSGYHKSRAGNAENDKSSADTFDAAALCGDVIDIDAFAAFSQLPDASAMFLATYFERGLPERFKLTNDEIIDMQSEMHRLTKRELLKEIHRLWAELCHPMPRGWRMPPLAKLVRQIQALTLLVVDVFASEAAGQKLTNHQIAKLLQSNGFKQAV